MLRREGLRFHIAVIGEGDLGPLRARLEARGAEIDKRWIGHSEVPGIMARADAVVLPSIEASQSGVAATALGHGVPVIATPAGGVVEQVRDGETGLLGSQHIGPGACCGDAPVCRRSQPSAGSASRRGRSPGGFIDGKLLGQLLSIH